MLGKVEGLGKLAIYVSQSLSQFVPTEITPVLVSALSARLAGNSEDYQKLKSLHLWVPWIILLLTGVVISFNLDWIVRLLFRESYYEAVILSRLTIWITAVQSLSGMMTQYVLSLGNTRAIAIIQVTSLALMVLVSILLIPEYKYIGLLIGQAVSVFFALIAYIRPALGDTHKPDHIFFCMLIFTSINLLILSFFLSIISFNLLITISISFVLLTITLVFITLGCFTNQEKLSAY